MSNNSGINLLNHAQLAFQTGNAGDALDKYRKCIKKILNDENVTALAPAAIPDNYPRELLGFAWSGFLGCFKQTSLKLTEDTAPESYNLLKSFKPGSNSPQFQKWSSRFQSTERGRILLKGLQITAGFVLGQLAWDKKDRATAARRYQEALELARTHTPFICFPNNRVGLERYVSVDVQQMEDNLKLLEFNDTHNASRAASQGQSTGRRDVVEVPIHVRVEGNGELNHANSIMLATNACAKCGIHKMGLQKCSRCKSTLYCGAECQRSHWTSHKATCRRPAQSG